MADRDSVETHLMIIKTWASFALEKDINFFEPAHFRDVVRWVGDAIALLKEQPEIVRCKDCKYYDHFNGCMSWHDVNSNNDNWYCADGERR